MCVTLIDSNMVKLRFLGLSEPKATKRSGVVGHMSAWTVADCPTVSFSFVYLHNNKQISKCKTVEFGDQLLRQQIGNTKEEGVEYQN